MKEHKGNKLFWIIVTTMTIMMGMLAYSTVQNGGINTQGTKGTETYKTLADVQSNTGMKLTVPSSIDTDKILEIRSIMGQLVEVRADHYVLKAALFVDVNADPLGLYDEAIIDRKYTVSNSDTKFFRYRTGYPEYENCTIINWCNSTTSLGIMLDDIITEEEAIELMELDTNNLQKYSLEAIEDTAKEYTDSNIVWVPYSIASDTLTISLPKTESLIKSVDLDGYTILFLNNSRCLVVVYTDYAMDTDVFGGQGQIDIDEHTRLCYLLENEFDNNTEEYRDYTLFLNNIQDIASKITKN